MGGISEDWFERDAVENSVVNDIIANKMSAEKSDVRRRH